MKARALVSITALILVILIIAGGCATDKKVTKKDYRFVAGTWINEEYNSHPWRVKYVIHSDGTFDSYNRISDTGKLDSGHYIIKEKWIDSEGNIWYKMHTWGGVIVEGRPDSYSLDKFSKSGKVWEYIQLSGGYPTEMDESIFEYHIYYRQ